MSKPDARPAFAAEHSRCLSPDERQAKIGAHAVIPLSKAMRAVKVQRRELVRASLCERTASSSSSEREISH